MQHSNSLGLRKVLWLFALCLGLILLFGLCILLVGLILYWLEGTAISSAQSIYVGTICGLVVLLFLSVFHLKREIVLLPYHDRAAFVGSLENNLQEMGYQAVKQSEEELLYSPPFHSWLLGGKIRVEVKDDSARIVGPKVYLEMLRSKLRVQSHLKDLTRTLRDSQHLHLNQALKRLEIRMRITREQWPAVYREVIEVLAKEGALIVCDVNILAQHEKGIEQRSVELPIRGWLQQQGIEAKWSRERVAPVTLDQSQTVPAKEGDG
jgi:hypothetical protein